MLQTLVKKFNLSSAVERILFDISLIVLIVCIVFGFVVIGWLVQPSKILTIYNEPIPTLHDGGKPGDTVVFIINYCKNSDAKGSVFWEMVGTASVTILPPYVDSTGKSCNKELLDPVVIPPQLKPGVYYVIWQVTYPVNPLKQDYVEFRSGNFTINK